MCPSHGFTFHPNFIGASGLFVCFNWINFSETDLCRRAMGRSIAINPARELLTVFILESFNSSEGGGGVSFTSFYNLIILIFKSYMTHLSQSQSKCIVSTIRLTPFAWKEKKKKKKSNLSSWKNFSSISVLALEMHSCMNKLFSAKVRRIYCCFTGHFCLCSSHWFTVGGARLA